MIDALGLPAEDLLALLIIVIVIMWCLMVDSR
jgi:hypothetical protein